MTSSNRISEDSKRPWHLVICGPLDHGGYVQSSYIEGGLHKVDSFDCNRTINKTIDKWGRLFETIRLVTWTSQAKLISPELKAKGIDIQLLEDPGRKSSFCGDSRVRVMTATIAGAEKIADHNSFVVRMRSDQFFDLGTFIRNHEKAERVIRLNQSRIGAQLPHISGLCFWLDCPYALRNYAHAGIVRDLKGFAQAQLLYRHASALANPGWPEGDTIRKHLFSLRDQLAPYGFRGVHCFPDLPKSIRHSDGVGGNLKIPMRALRLWKFALSNIYSVASSKVMDSLVWKGHPYPPSKIFDGMGCRKHWKQCVRHDLYPIRKYCAQQLSTCLSMPWSDLLWTLPGTGERIAGLPLSREAKIASLVKGWAARGGVLNP